MGTDDEEIDFRKKFQLELIRYSSQPIREMLRPGKSYRQRSKLGALFDAEFVLIGQSGIMA